MVVSSTGWVCSTMTTASALGASIPPVCAPAASPWAMSNLGWLPVGTSPATRR